MKRRMQLPDAFLRELKQLEPAYLHRSGPIEQFGFSGGAERWRAGREPLLDAIKSDGELLSTGCANGYLLECLVVWRRQRGNTLMPYGLDQGSRLIELARRYQPHLANHFSLATRGTGNRRGCSSTFTHCSIKCRPTILNRIFSACIRE